MTLEELKKVLATYAPGTLVPLDWIRHQLDQIDSEPSGDPLVDLTVKQTAELLGRSPSTIREYLRAGLFPGAYKMRGREWRVPRDGIREFQRAEAAPKSPPPKTRSRQGRQEVDLGAWRKEFE